MSVDTKSPKGRQAKKIRRARGPVKEYRCQFCGTAAPIAEWMKDGHDHCPNPNCGKAPDLAALGVGAVN